METLLSKNASKITEHEYVGEMRLTWGPTVNSWNV